MVVIVVVLLVGERCCELVAHLGDGLLVLLGDFRFHHVHALWARMSSMIQYTVSEGDELGEVLGDSEGDPLGDSDGDSEGDELGTSLGISLGDSDGAPLGDSDGDSEGDELAKVLGDLEVNPLGFPLGDTLGTSLGISLGDSDGAPLRDSDGDSEGDELGEVLGTSVGDSEGDPLDFSLGDTLGDSEGDPLGLSLGAVEGCSETNGETTFELSTSSTVTPFSVRSSFTALSIFPPSNAVLTVCAALMASKCIIQFQRYQFRSSCDNLIRLAVIIIIIL